VQTTGLPPVHVPFWQVSVCVHAFESVHAVPLVTGVCFTPATGSQLSVVQGLLSSIGTVLPGWHVLDWQLSPAVHALPSLHVAPFGLGEQVPTVPVRLQAKHEFVQVVLQQTPLAQNPETHWLFVVQVTPRDGS